MYYFKKFSTYNEYLSYKNGTNFLLPNLSLTTSDNKTYYTPYQNKAGDILICNGSRFFTVSQNKLSDVWDSSIYSLEGIVVVPNTHTPDGTTRVISLASMSLETPDTGSLTTNNTMYWGGYQTQVCLDSHPNKVKTTSNESENTTYGTSSYGYLPSDAFTGNQSVVDPETKYYYDGVNNTTQTPFIESAYLSDGTPNPNYKFGTLNDFDGYGNTQKILTYATAEDWQNLTSLTNSYDANFYPSAEACKRYHTANIQNWYLPAEGELGYLPCRYTAINTATTVINNVCGSGNALSIPRSWFWSSSENSVSTSYGVLTSDGGVGIDYKYDRGYVRAFASVPVCLGISN